ncbi:MAG: tetratricopeptide repeat protein [Chlorobiaceae bacterium]|nr:tetratricopeptide repeat protein [Chlorobiaceae bacterium]NTV61021.1 tetratricopeptide repeat protein [Chlorobiaceae bacterium]
MTHPSSDGTEECGNADISRPHLFFMGVTSELCEGNYQVGLALLKPFSGLFSDSYLFNLLYAKALKGLGKHSLAVEYFRKCCAIAPSNQVAWTELLRLQTSVHQELQEIGAGADDPVTDELEKLSAALMRFEPVKTTETYDPTPLADQKQPFPDDIAIAVPTETLAQLFREQGAYRKAVTVYSLLIKIKPQNAEHYRKEIDSLLESM